MPKKSISIICFPLEKSKIIHRYYHFFLLHFRNDYKDYMLQSRLHFRIHAVQTDIRAMMKKSKKENLEESSNNIDHLMPLQNADLHSMNGESFEIPNTESDAKKIIQAR